MRKYFWIYLVSLGVFFAIDMVWLGFAAQPFYQAQIGFLLADETNWIPAIVFYLLFVAGIVYFAVLPGLKESSLKQACLRGAMFGLIAYATYDLTNLATLDGWPLVLVIVDMTWGTVLSLVVSAAGYLYGKKTGQTGVK